MISFSRLFQSLAVRTAFALIIIGSISYLGWRFRVAPKLDRLIVEDATVHGDVVVDPTVTPYPASSHAMSEGVTFKLLSLERASSITPPRVVEAQRSYLGEQHISTPSARIQKYQLKYEVQTEKGEYVPVTASIYLSLEHGSGLPWLVFGAGTSGLDDRCAPSLEKVHVSNIGNYENQMIAYAAQGVLVIFPDYVGFSDGQRLQPYFVAEMEARVLLGAAVTFSEAARQYPEFEGLRTESIFLSGYSQGGHAALSAASRRFLLPSELKIKGVVAFASAANVHALFLESPRLGPYILRSYQDYYGNIHPEQYLQPQWLEKFEKHTREVCVDHIGKAFVNNVDQLYTAEFAAALRSQTLAISYPQLDEYLGRNTTFSELQGVPVYLIQGGADPIVTARTQRAFRKQLCDAGVPVSYIEYPGVNHYTTRQRGFFESIQWMQAVQRGLPITLGCE